jgi:ABC-type phosphate/phosphonate transport system substrate-binding protein
MYNASASAGKAWRALFGRVFDDAGVAIEMIEHGAPLPIHDLWSRENLCCAFMCGWPFVHANPPMQAIAAPVPAPTRYGGLPRYCSEFLVREASGWTKLEDAFGHRFGWMAANSQAGFNAPRAHLARSISAERPVLFSDVAGPLGTPALSLKALREGIVDVVALDSFYLDLLRHHEPSALAGIRCVATTDWSPIPLLVAAPGVPHDVVETLRAHLVEAGERPAYARLLADACVQRFTTPDAHGYRALEAMAEDAARRGYERIR